MILGFKSQFVPAVVAGTKPHTIRTGSRWRKGMSIQFYENVRQPTMRKIRPDAMAVYVQTITIEAAPERYLGPPQWPTVTIDGRQLRPYQIQQLAQKDGFDTCDQMMKWFRDNHGLPFTGQLIGWDDLPY